MKVNRIIKELEDIKRHVVSLECYPSNKLALDIWVIEMIDLILEEHFKKKPQKVCEICHNEKYDIYWIAFPQYNEKGNYIGDKFAHKNCVDFQKENKA
jgi:hypothetical protein